MQGNQHWIAVPVEEMDSTVLLKHASGSCLELATTEQGRELHLLKACDPTNLAMRWTWGHFDLSKLEKVNH